MTATMKIRALVSSTVVALFVCQLEACVPLLVIEQSTAPSEANCNKLCGRDYSPVCGSDGLTYSNRCMMEIESCETGSHITELHDGECGKRARGEDGNLQFLPRGAVPVRANTSASNDSRILSRQKRFFKHLVNAGRNFVNTVKKVPQRAVEEARKNPFLNKLPFFKPKQEQPRCNGACTKVLRPVCGSDGQTYSNKCIMDFKSCESGSRIAVAHDGECRNCNMACDKDLKPVCGSDGVTYSNNCMMERESCETGSEITEVHSGDCDLGETTDYEYSEYYITDYYAYGGCDRDTPCPADLIPVCGSDGLTYSNECEMKKETCESVTVQHEGPCRQ